MNKNTVKRKSTISRFIHYYKPYKGIFILDLIAAFLMSLIAMLYPIVTRTIFSTFVPEGNVPMIITLGLSLIGIYIIRFLLRMFVDYFGHRMGVYMQHDMRRDLFTKLEELPFSFYDNHETGAIMSRMTTDLQDVSELAHHGPENFFITGTMIIGSFIYLLSINWILALVIFCCAPILLLISLSTRRKHLNAYKETRKDLAIINASIESSITGIRVTKAFNNKDKEIEKFEKSNNQYVKSRSRVYKYMALFHSSTSFVVDLFNVACIVGGGIITITTGYFTVADYLAFAVSISLFTSPINTIVQFVEQFQDGSSGFLRFLEIMDEKTEFDYKDALEDVNLSGNIVFKNVDFSYATTSEVLKNVSFEIKKGETIALVGESGGGKTTICHLLPHFYNVSHGNIYYDNFDINEISFKALRKNIGIVQQDVFLFSGTIKDNILYGKLDATDEEVIEACKKAHLYKFIETLPNGIDTEVGERGVKLSGGQKQRVAIARIFLKNPSILILDEATSALDNTTEVSIQKSLSELAIGRTSIIVAHRLSTIKNADRIFVVNNGKIVESGSHEELMALKNEYYKLYNLQFKVGTFN